MVISDFGRPLFQIKLQLLSTTLLNGFQSSPPARRQAITRTNTDYFQFAHVSEIWIEIRIFSLKKMNLNLSSAKWRLISSIAHFPLTWFRCFQDGFVNGSSVCVNKDLELQQKKPNHQISNISRTESQTFKVSRLVLQLPLPNPMKPGVKSRMKM